MAGIGGRETLRVVDVGCGEGATIGYLRELHPGWEVSGIDADPAFCAAGMTETGRAESLPFPDGSIDVILMECSLSKTEQPERAAAEAFRENRRLAVNQRYVRPPPGDPVRRGRDAGAAGRRAPHLETPDGGGIFCV